MSAMRWLDGSAGRSQGISLGPRTDRPDIAASEIAEFCFCARAWWLRRIRGLTVEPPKLQAGRATHARVGAAVARVFVLRAWSGRPSWWLGRS